MTTYTHGHHESVLRSHRWRTAENSAAYLLPHLTSDQRLLDVGCGPGTLTLDLAGRVGSVTALEQTADALDLARAEAARQNATDVEFAVGDVHDLPFPDDGFDVVHAHQVLQHVADPVQALREMRRVTRPGGIVAVRDSDYAAFAWYPAATGAGRVGGALPAVRPGQRGRARRRSSSAVLGPGGRVLRGHPDRRGVVLRDPRRPRLVGRDVGGPDPAVSDGGAGSRRWLRDPRRSAGDLRRLDRLGRDAGRLVLDPARRDSGPSLTERQRYPRRM